MTELTDKYIENFENILPLEEAVKMAMEVYGFSSEDAARDYVLIASGRIKSDIVVGEP